MQMVLRTVITLAPFSVVGSWLPEISAVWRRACSSARRTWTTFMSTQDRRTSSTCTGNSSTAVATVHPRSI
jgi:hypothetical protein